MRKLNLNEALLAMKEVYFFFIGPCRFVEVVHCKILGVSVWSACSVCGMERRYQLDSVSPETQRSSGVGILRHHSSHSKIPFANCGDFFYMLAAPTAATMALRERENQRRILMKNWKWLQFQKNIVHSNRWTQFWVKESSCHFEKGNIWIKHPEKLWQRELWDWGNM